MSPECRCQWLLPKPQKNQSTRLVGRFIVQIRQSLAGQSRSNQLRRALNPIMFRKGLIPIH